MKFLKKKKKSGYGYGYGYGYGRGYSYGKGHEDDGGGLCDKMNFTSAEAYKMLRTKINLILPQELISDENGETSESNCMTMGVSSAMRGEGKTTTSINLAYTIAETQKKVCLIEADMRLPNISKRLSLKESPGLSNVLSGQCRIKESLQRYAAKNGTNIYVITSGDIPPTPSELLESKNMESLLKELKSVFDVIIIDLPPVTVVTDALSVASKLDGMLVVARQDHTDKRLLQDAIYQFKLTETKLLGVVFNCSDGPMGAPTYRKKRYYKKYYKKYGEPYRNEYRKEAVDNPENT